MQELIKNSGLTIKEFSEEYGIPYNSVRQWYNGERKAPTYIKTLIEKLRNAKTQGKQLGIKELENYLVEIIHPASNTRVYSRIITYQEYLEFETNYWYVEYIKNKKGYKVNYYFLHKI